MLPFRLLLKQFNVLRDLLEDPNPLVRATGAEGVCRVGSIFWELIPAVGIHKKSFIRLDKPPFRFSEHNFCTFAEVGERPGA